MERKSFTFEITPGDTRDLSPSMEGIIGLSGNQSETAIYGRLNWVNGKAVTTMFFTPTGWVMVSFG